MRNTTIRVAIALMVSALLAPAALAWPGKPAQAPPKPPNPGAPPPAWIETASRSSWLAYGSYCWRTTCVDMIPPQTRPDLPLVAVTRGRMIRVHFGFSVRTARASVDGRVVRAGLDVTRRVVSWQAARGGILTVFVRPESGDASYHARLRLG